MQIRSGRLLLLAVALGDEQNELVLGERCLNGGQRRRAANEERDYYIGENDNITERKDRNPIRRRDGLTVALKDLGQLQPTLLSSALSARSPAVAACHW